MVGDGAQSALPVGRLAPLAECDHDREHGDDAERHALRDEPDARDLVHGAFLRRRV
jgi:hypothetical protein